LTYAAQLLDFSKRSLSITADNMRSSNAEGVGFPARESEVSIETKEKYWPLIGPEESRFIENTGGEYQGFVDRADGGREFQDLLVGHCAYYDTDRREVVEAVVTTEAVNEEGGNEMSGPGGVKGYTAMIVYRSRSGETLHKPGIIHIGEPGTEIDPAEVRRLAHLAHRYLVENIASLLPTELETRVHAIVAERLSASRSNR
jgi:hypothetical protein